MSAASASVPLLTPNLHLSRLRFVVRPTADLRLPEYAGSALRGAFGHALRRLACMTKQKSCEGCPLRQTCPYSVLFESLPPQSVGGTGGMGRVAEMRDAPRPYVIEPPAWGQQHWAAGECFSFHVVLFGRALTQIPLIIFAWQRALAHGLGASGNEVPCELLSVWQTGLPDGDHGLFSAEDNSSNELAPLPALPPLPTQANTLQLRFYTPLRLQENGRALTGKNISLKRLLTTLARRVHYLSLCHENNPSSEADIVALYELGKDPSDLAETHNLHWQDWTRHSSRQQTRMTLGGLVGTWQLSGNLAPYWPLLYLGQFTHLGKETVFGFGGYRLENISAKTA